MSKPLAFFLIKILSFDYRCLNGVLYEQNLIRTIDLVGEGVPPHDLMGLAIHNGNETYVNYLLRNGYPVNTFVNGTTPLGQSLLYQNGEITLSLLDYGADPTVEYENQTTPLLLLALRPLGSYMLAIAKKMVESGATSKRQPVAHALLYRRAVIEGYADVADFLLSHDPETSSESENYELLRDFLTQNTHQSVRGIKYLLHSIAKPFTSDILVDADRGETVFHVLCKVAEDIRDDPLNLGILQMMLQKFASLHALDFTNKRGETALMCAVHEGNFHALDALLRAGADLKAGSYCPKLEALRRLIDPKVFTGGFQGLSNRHRKSRRYDNNSMLMMTIMLKHECQTPMVSNALGKDMIERALPTWRSTALLGLGIANAPPQLQDLTVAQDGSNQALRESGQLGGLKYADSAMQGLWDRVEGDWKDMIEHALKG